MRIHVLKSGTFYWDAQDSSLKTFELRVDDRGYQVGDVLLLRRYDPEGEFYTGGILGRRVTYVVRGGVVPADQVAMATVPLTSDEWEAAVDHLFMESVLTSSVKCPSSVP